MVRTNKDNKIGMFSSSSLNGPPFFLSSLSLKIQLITLNDHHNSDKNRGEPIISTRNFDPETRTLRKRTADDDVDMEDTVEKNIAGLAEAIVAEDEAKRAQELVCISIVSLVMVSMIWTSFSRHIGFVEYRAQARQLGFEKGTREKDSQARTEDTRGNPHTYSYVTIAISSSS